MSYNQGWDDGITGFRVGCFLAVLAIVLLLCLLGFMALGLMNLAAA